MSIGSSSVLSASPSVGKCNLVPVADVLPEASAVSDLVEVSSLEMSQRVPVIPRTAFHLRVEFEDGRDVYVSFDGRVQTDHDDNCTYADAQLSNWHINGLPADPDAVDCPL